MIKNSWEKRKRKKRDLLDNLHLAFVIFVILIYLVAAPILFYNEYKENDSFRNLLTCEYKYESSKCLEVIEISEKSSQITTIVLFYWIFVIIVQDFWPNRNKIQEFLEKKLKI